MEDKKEKGEREGQRKVKRWATHKNQRKERASPSQDRKLSHPQPLMLLACKSKRSNNSGRSKIRNYVL